MFFDLGIGRETKRKYDCPKVKPGDWVYFLEDLKYETKYCYKVVRAQKDLLTVEVNEDKKDPFIGGWPDQIIGNGRYWSVDLWTKKKSCSIEIE